MFEARQCVETPDWYVCDGSLYLLTDGTVVETAELLEASVIDRLYFKLEAAALAAIHAHYHGGDTDIIEPGDIAATLREEGE
jgi:hypothetical protein